MFNDETPVRGELEIIVRDVTTNASYTIVVPNLVVTAGKTFIASRMTANTAVVMATMAVGTSGTAANAADVALGTQVASVNLAVAGALHQLIQCYIQLRSLLVQVLVRCKRLVSLVPSCSPVLYLQ